MSDTLVVYYSRTGKTRWVAEQLAQALGADIEQITEKKDRSGALGFAAAVKDALLNKPAELTSRHGVEGRKTVVIGMPVWASSPPPAVRAYLSAVDLTAKTVCAFVTTESSGIEKTLDSTASLVPGGLAERIGFKKVKPGDSDLLAHVRQWAGRVNFTAK